MVHWVLIYWVIRFQDVATGHVEFADKQYCESTRAALMEEAKDGVIVTAMCQEAGYIEH